MAHLLKVIQPNEKFKHIIEFFYEIETTLDSDACSFQKILPCGHAMIIFTWDGFWQINTKTHLFQLPSCYITGQADSYFYLKPTADLKSFGIAFKPHAFNLLFGWDLSEFNEKTYSLESVFGIEGVFLIEQIISSKDIGQRICVAEGFLMKCLQRSEMKYDSHIIIHALQLINQHHGNINVQTISSFFHMSERHIERIFKHHIGIGPKRWANLIRCIHVMRFLSQGKASPLDLAAWFNYFDHSHFYKDFYRFSGETFSQWSLQAHPLLDKLLEKDFLGPH